MILTFSIEDMSLMSKFIVLVEAFIGYFKKIIQPNISILYTEMHIGITCIGLMYSDKMQVIC